MKLYAIENEFGLQGKTILKTRLLGVNCYLFIVTTDGGIIVARVDVDWDNDDEYCVRPIQRLELENWIVQNISLKKALLGTGKITQDDLDDFAAEYLARQEQERQAMRKRQEEREREEYLRLKNKYEAGDPHDE